MLFRLLIFIVVSLASFSGYGQASQPIASQNNRFSFPESLVCATYGTGDEIIINTTALECDGDPPCVVDFNYDPTEGFGNKPDPNNPNVFISDPDNIRLFQDGQAINYAFTQPGSYNIAILIGAGTNNFDQLVQPIVVLPSTAPTFNIYNCTPGEVQVEITDTAFPLFAVDYDQDDVTDVQAGTGIVTPSYTYPVGQSQGIVSVRPDYLGCTENTKTTLLANAPVTGNHFISQLEVASPGSTSLIFQNIQTNIPYVLERSVNGAGSFTVIEQFTSTSFTSDNTVNTDDNFYCYRLGARDICNNQTFYSNTICSHTIDLDVRDGSNVITWETNLPGAGSLTLMKNTSPLGAAFTNNGTYTDSDVTCGTEYCYNLITSYGGDVYSISNIRCGTAISSQPPVPLSDITSVVDGNSVRLDWVPTPGYTISEYGIFRIPTNVSVPYAKTAEPTLTDNIYQPFNGVCYEVRFDDVCKNRSPRSQIVCPIELKATLNNNDNSVLLEWNEYNGWGQGVDHYTIEKYDGNGQLISAIDSEQTSYTDNATSPGQVFTYRILAIPISTSVPQPSISNTQTITKSVMLYHPTAFIPVNANDDRNKTFSVQGIEEYITSYELRIFNRWGELMFHSTDMSSGWDGTFKGVTMPEGTYVFKTQIIDTAGRTFDYSGSVVLLRK